jgi:hypothetical protein
MIRSRSFRGSRRNVLVTVGATIASHSGSSGVRLELRSQLAQLDGLAPPICGPTFLGSRSIILGIRLVVQWSGLKDRHEGITSASQEDARGIHALIWKLVHQAV